MRRFGRQGTDRLGDLLSRRTAATLSEIAHREIAPIGEQRRQAPLRRSCGQLEESGFLAGAESLDRGLKICRTTAPRRGAEAKPARWAHMEGKIQHQILSHGPTIEELSGDGEAPFLSPQAWIRVFGHRSHHTRFATESMPVTCHPLRVELEQSLFRSQETWPIRESCKKYL